MSLSLCTLLAQDVIILKSGDEIKSKVLEINDREIKYKRFDNLDGPVISTLKTEVFMIKYQNGTKEVINSTAPVTGPENTTNTSSRPYVDPNPNRFGLYVNPLGFVQFGPMVGMEITRNSHLIIDGHARFSSAGVLMYEISRSSSGTAPYKISGLGVGGGLKYLSPSRIGGFYIGFLMEYGWQTQFYDKDESWEWQEDVNYFVTVANVGYKFRFSGGFYINTGALLGTAYVFKDEWYYTKSYYYNTARHDNGSKVKPFGMLEAGLGIEF